MAPQLVAQLRVWRLASPPTDLDLVFPNAAGNPIDTNNMIKRHFLPALKKAGIPKIRFHDLRHTYASRLIAQGENPKYIQHQMGHSSIRTTFDIYGHLMKDENQQAAMKLGISIFGEDGSKMVAGTIKGHGQTNVTP